MSSTAVKVRSPKRKDPSSRERSAAVCGEDSDALPRGELPPSSENSESPSYDCAAAPRPDLGALSIGLRTVNF